MRAPTPTRALVHRSTLVTAGLVIIIAYTDLLIDNYSLIIMSTLGFMTMVCGSLLALLEARVKRVVAYSTLSQMGLRMMEYGLGSLHFGLLNLISHGFAKRLLFMQVGYLIHMRGGQQNVRCWQMAGSVEGSMKGQLILSLMSLRGTAFIRGINSKELLLGLMLVNRLHAVILWTITLCIFITMGYRVIIYKSLFNRRGQSVIHHSGSVSAIIITRLEAVLVVGHFGWVAQNVVQTRKVHPLRDMAVLVGVLLARVSLLTFLGSGDKMFVETGLLISLMMSIQHYG